MKIIHTADWHIGKLLNGYSLLADQEALLRDWLNQVVALKPDLVIMSGDLYDRSLPSAEATRLVNQLLTEMTQVLTCPICVIAGNHDSADRIDYASDLLAHHQLYLVGQPSSKPVKIEIDQADVYLLPYASTSALRQVYPQATIKNLQDGCQYQLDLIRDQWDSGRINIVAYHGYVTAASGDQAGGDLTMSDSERPLEIGTAEFVPVQAFKGFDYVALGHLHQAQKVANDHIRYAGSLLKYSKSEAYHKKQFLEVDLTKDNLLVKSHFFKPVRDLRIIRANFAELLKDGTSDYVFLELTDKVLIHDAVNRLRQSYPYLMGMEYINLDFNEEVALEAPTMAEVDLADQDLPNLFGKFYQQVEGQAMSTRQLDLVKEIYQASQKEGQDETD
ncbi:exonuclease sbcCD subunit D [Aerococcus urinaehominis]|uniref:Nuclease SbcCD subunit D n=1 Tax=Aerococcus urinaehominis TaxID=128944 RepID=A0A120IAX2_9LACT|nr:exonuclease SbcCD subunit D [Aerococcus urinaehominis]AMB99428.1 exonuclease sbcCD subunit D [Aerococcus urinaehominis]SDM29504.1 Exodeoxyribonuclease I subunit D [Aerococcus urinaehominis]